MPRPIEKGMIVRIKDVDEAGVWRGLTGEVTRVKGPNINVKTWEGTARLTAAELDPSPQLPLYLS